MNLKKQRFLYVLMFLVAVISGLLSRSALFDFPQFVDDNLGDVLWGSMVYFMICTIWVKALPKMKILVAVLFSFSIEFSQLINTPWFDTFRDIPGMRLVFGYGFRWSDLICYTLGIALAYFVDRSLFKMDLSMNQSNPA